ncbi:MAG: hypothetical protein M3Z66_10945 [Chloroflexota bacterium]|nr:hypothetical protein [Chloroflexota bacterium]
MHEPIAHAPLGWQSFYTLSGVAAATLAGLLFVALQFGTGVRVPARLPSAIETFVRPTFLRFVDVLVEERPVSG